MYKYSKEMDEILVYLPKEKQVYLIGFLDNVRRLIKDIDEMRIKLEALEQAMKGFER